jgi:hypothetical protein
MDYILRKGQLTPIAVNNVTTDPVLSNGAKVLYCYLISLPTGSNVSNESIMEDCCIVSIAMVNTYKRELKKLDLLYENKDKMTNIRLMYVGTYNLKAKLYAEDWKRVAIEDV